MLVIYQCSGYLNCTNFVEKRQYMDYNINFWDDEFFYIVFILLKIWTCDPGEHINTVLSSH